ncbi:MAG: site-specific integrase [Waterburya sp.]
MLEFFPVDDSSIIADNQRVNRKLATKPRGIDEAFEEFLGFEVANGAASSDTIANYKSQTRLFLQWCCDVQLNPLLADKQHIQRYRKYLLDQDYKVATIELKLQVVRRFYDALIDCNLITFNPAKNVRMIKSLIFH